MIRIKHTRTLRHRIIIGLIVLIIVALGVYLYEANLRQTAVTPNRVSTERMPDLPAKITADKTPEVKKQHTVPPTHPKQLKIDSLGINANILAVGLTADGAMDAPVTAWDTGWYNQSSTPGKGSGALLIDGHVNNTIGTPGVFFKIHSLKTGDTIQIERGDGKTYTYSVVTVEQKKIEDVDMAKMMRSATPGKQGLNLITCGGTYDPARQTFDDRVLVYAVETS